MMSGFDPHSGRCVVSLSEIHLPPKCTGYAQDAVALSFFLSILSRSNFDHHLRCGSVPT